MKTPIRSAVRTALDEVLVSLWEDVHKEVVQDLAFTAAFPRRGDLTLEILDPAYHVSRTVNLTARIKGAGSAIDNSK